MTELTDEALAELRKHFEMAKDDHTKIGISIRLRYYAALEKRASRLIDREIIALRATGASFPEIGRILGISKQAATQRHASAVKRTQESQG
jgi:DNA-directed RNA polymerase specialized sigma subunit